MSTLILAAHVGPGAESSFRAALPADDSVELHCFVEPGLSSAYHALAARLRDRRTRRLLPALLAHVGATSALEDYDQVLLVSWSAPYALAEEILSQPDDAAALSGWVALDSGYGAPTHGVVDLARRARDEKALYWAGATDVPTSGYADSRSFLAEVVRQAGEPAGFFRTEHWAHDPAVRRAAHDQGAFWRAEHIAALHRGPAFLAAALAALDGRARAPVSQQPPTRPNTRVMRFGDRGADVARLQALLNVAGASPLLTTDGVFGPRTQAAVAAAQQRAGLTVTGVAGGALLTALTPEQPTRDGAPDLGLAVLAMALQDLADGIRETAPNDGDDLRTLYFDPMGLAPGSEWCAPALASWLRRGAASIGVAAPFHGSAAAKGWIPLFQAAGEWIPKSRLTEEDIVPGAVVVFDRSTPGKPETAWKGHIGVVREHCVGGSYSAVEGNSGATSAEVAEMVHKFKESRLLGVGKFRR